MFLSKTPEDFLGLSIQIVERYECWITSDCVDTLLKSIENSINEDITNGIGNEFPEIWEELIGCGLKTFTIYMVIVAKDRDTSEIDRGILDWTCQKFPNLWPFSSQP